MIGHESIVTTDAVRCQCGHVLIPAEHLPETLTWTSSRPLDSFSYQAMAEREHANHIAELADRKLYGFDGDERLQHDAAAVYENWADDHDYKPENMLSPAWGRPPSLTIQEWTSTPASAGLMAADSVAEYVAEWLADDCGFEEIADLAYEAARDHDVVNAFRAALHAMATHMDRGSGFRVADRHVRDLIVTWDADGAPLLDGEPMYRKANP